MPEKSPLGNFEIKSEFYPGYEASYGGPSDVTRLTITFASKSNGELEQELLNQKVKDMNLWKDEPTYITHNNNTAINFTLLGKINEAEITELKEYISHLGAKEIMEAAYKVEKCEDDKKVAAHPEKKTDGHPNGKIYMSPSSQKVPGSSKPLSKEQLDSVIKKFEHKIEELEERFNAGKEKAGNASKGEVRLSPSLVEVPGSRRELSNAQRDSIIESWGNKAKAIEEELKKAAHDNGHKNENNNSSLPVHKKPAGKPVISH